MNLRDKILGIREETETFDSGWSFTERKRPPVWRILLTLLLLAGIPAGLVYWKRHAIKRYANEWTAENHLAEAKTAWEAQQYSVALRRTGTALELKPGEFEAEQLRFRAARKTGDYRLLQFGRLVMLHPEATEADIAESIAPLLDVGYLRDFGQIYHQFLNDEQRTHPEIHFQWLRYRLLQNRPDVTLAGLAAIDDAAVLDQPRYQVLEMRSRLASGGKEDMDRFGELALASIDRQAGSEE